MKRNESTKLPRFIIYQPNQKEFHFCLEVGNRFFCWKSNYPPTLDIRFTREIKRVADIQANKINLQRVFDKGTFSITKSDTKEIAEKKLQANIGKRSFAFILNGKKLNGRFLIKKTAGGTVIQKYKDKYALEEDILSGDLSRTIRTMIPDYDASKIKLGPPSKSKSKQVSVAEDEDFEEITADDLIGDIQYHFAFYTSADEPDICLITDVGGEILVAKKVGKDWELATNVPKRALRHASEFVAHIEALYNKK